MYRLLSGSWDVAGCPHYYEQLVNQCFYLCGQAVE
jgi:hypothetical protein